MAKFLICLPRYHTNVVPWVRILQEAGHEIEMHCMIRGPTENHTLLSPRVHLPSRLSLFFGGTEENDRRLFPKFSIVQNAVKKASPDVVIVRGLTRWFMRMVAAIALLQGRRLVVYDQETPNPAFSSTWLRRALCRTVGVAHFTPKLDIGGALTKGYALQIPFGCAFDSNIAAQFCKRKLHWPARILMVAKYRERKRHADLLRALGKLAPKYQFSVTFCGEEVSETDTDFCNELRSVAQELGIGPRLFFKNNIPHNDMARVYVEHDLFVLPSTNEPAAVSPLEAVWCGCAVVIARSSGTRSYLPPSRKFDFVDDDPDDLVRALSEMLRAANSLESARDDCVDRLSSSTSDTQVLARFEELLI